MTDFFNNKILDIERLVVIIMIVIVKSKCAGATQNPTR